MSAPLTVNTKDGVCWTRRTVTSGGIALYAPKGVCKCPEFVMATLAELAEHGITGSADVLPVPVGPEPQTLSGEQLAEIRSSVRGEVRLAPRAWMTLTAALLADYDRLLTERHETNEALDDAVQELRARPVEEPSTGGYPPAVPWAALMDREDLTDFLDELAAAAITHASSDVALAEVESTIARWRLIAEAQHGHNTAPGPAAMSQSFAPVAALREVLDGEHWSTVHHDYKGPGRDFPELGGVR